MPLCTSLGLIHHGHSVLLQSRATSMYNPCRCLQLLRGVGASPGGAPNAQYTSRALGHLSAVACPVAWVPTPSYTLKFVHIPISLPPLLGSLTGTFLQRTLQDQHTRRAHRSIQGMHAQRDMPPV